MLRPDFHVENKIVIGFFSPESRLVRLIEALRGYPRPDVWWIGLALVDPTSAARGWGVASAWPLRNGRAPREQSLSS